MKPEPKPGMSDAQVDEAARLFRTLSEPSRLLLLRALMAGPLTVSELVEATGLKQGNASKHLGVLLQAHFVSREKEGNFARYTISDQHVFALCDLMCRRMGSEAQSLIKAFGPKT